MVVKPRPSLDQVDRQILAALVTDGRLTFHQLAAAVHLSATATADRVRRLRAIGVLSGYHASVDLEVLGYELQAMSDVKVHETIARADFEAHLAGIPEVLSAIHTTGEYDYQLRVVTTGPADLERIIDELRAAGVREIHSRIVLGETIFNPTRLLR
jgi:Lrp/AsnC family transcriptional regulator, leucine-responsive regulatory protein